MHTKAANSRFLIGRTSRNRNQRAFYQKPSVAIEWLASALADYSETVLRAERALALTEMEQLGEAARVLCHSPVASIGLYYVGMYDLRAGRIDRSVNILESITARTLPLAYRARALNALGGIAFKAERFSQARRYYSSAARIAETCDLRSFAQARKMLADIEGIETHPRRGIEELRRIAPLIRQASINYPLLATDYANSLSVAFSEVNEIEQAVSVARSVAASPFCALYQDFRNTVAEVESLAQRRANRPRPRLVNSSNPRPLVPLKIILEEEVIYDDQITEDDARCVLRLVDRLMRK